MSRFPITPAAALLLGTTALTAAMLPTAAFAQTTTSSVSGLVTTEAGLPIAGASVTLVNTQTGFARVVTTDASGTFAVRSLSVTGAYDITVNAPGYQGERVEDVALTLGDQAAFNFDLSTEITDEIVVVGQRQVIADLAIGPAASFGLDVLENAPTINRNITDVLRLDPRISVDESRGGINAIQCVGQNPRFNSTTLDGVPVNDSFGLNSNGYPTERQPFPFDAIEQVSVEIAPFDVIYGGFTACNINAVTKSGTNEFRGTAFIDYTDDGLRGDKAGTTEFDFGNFDEIRYGVGVGGPIIKDKLFFYASYEKLEGANLYAPTPGLDSAVVNRIADISNRIYDYDPGVTPTSNPNFDEKVLVKLDWNISDMHRAAATFNYNDGNNIVRSDGDPDEFEFSNHLYERGAEQLSYAGQLFSDWTENFSTELRASYLDLDNRQIPQGGTDFGEFRISEGGIDYYLGSDDSRGANKLTYDTLNLAGIANYQLGNHTLTGGIEYQELDVFNLFVQQAQTETRFNGIDEFEAGIASQVEFNGAVSGNINDAAANWGYSTLALYGQDEFTLGDNLTVVAGLRYDAYNSSDLPAENPDFVEQYGFSNAQNLDGKDLWQPRLGLTWDASDVFQLRAGLGRFAGGNPNVWVSNAYSGTNVTQVGARIRDRDDGIDLFDLDYTLAEEGVPNGPGYAVPTVLADAVATGQGSNFELNYVDPDFDIPSNWKYSLGATWSPDVRMNTPFMDGPWTFSFDALYLSSADTAIISRADLVAAGTRDVSGVDDSGVPYDLTVTDYDSPNLDAFVLTNSDVSNEAINLSIGAAKEYDNGIGLTLGYSYTDAKDVQPMTSAVAFSNYNNRAFNDPEEQILSTSNYSVKHRFTSSLTYDHAFFGDYKTNFFAFLLSQSGSPYSRTLNGAANDIYGFTPFLGNGGDSVLQPGTERNEFRAPNWTKVDFRIGQELPGLRADDRSEIFMVIDNLTNLIDSDWGVLETAGFPGTLSENERFSINTASAYEVRFGARYEF